MDWAGNVGAKEYIEAQQFRCGFTARVEQLFSECDVLVAPAATVTAMPIAERPSDYGRNGWKNSAIFNLTGSSFHLRALRLYKGRPPSGTDDDRAII